MSDGTVTPEQIVINGQEYTPEEATQYLDLGKKYKDLESQLNTSLDKVYPEYTKSTQKVKELEVTLAERNTELEKLQKEREVKVTTNPDREAIIKAARENGLADQDWLKEQGYMTKPEMDEYYSQKQTQQKLVDSILSTAGKLEKEIDGSDGRVPFDSDAVLAYASAYNIPDLNEAYDKMNTKGNAKWKEAQIAAEERPGLTTLKGGGKKTPEKVQITDNNLGEHLNEWLTGLNAGTTE